MSGFKREIQFLPAFDKRSTEPNKNFGIGSVKMRWLLRGDRGVIQFMTYTGWDLPHVRAERGSNSAACFPMAVDIGYHSPVAMYEGQEPMIGDCEILGGTCYYDGSGLQAQRFLDALISEGHEKVWQLMEAWYAAQFCSQSVQAKSECSA